ncbi:MAG: SDR family oxidoreductase [Desulfobacterales bacterium]|nr:SDR family oxidoreductase [Desulfobacterales bacterium]
MDFEGRNAIVTGGAAGIGKAVAQHLVAKGAQVIIGDINFAKAQETAADIEPSEQRCQAYPLDLADMDSIDTFVTGIKPSSRKVDILVNCAGMAAPEEFFELTPKQWDRIMDINLKGTFFLSQKISKAMSEAQYGRIVNLSSASAFTPSTRPMVSYDVSKAALVMLTKVMALKLASYGITVNSVAPGPVVTDLLRQFFDDPTTLEKGVEGIPIGRLAQPEDVVEAILFFCSERAGYITGTTLPVEGGNLLVKHIVYGVE